MTKKLVANRSNGEIQTERQRKTDRGKDKDRERQVDRHRERKRKREREMLSCIILCKLTVVCIERDHSPTESGSEPEVPSDDAVESDVDEMVRTSERRVLSTQSVEELGFNELLPVLHPPLHSLIAHFDDE